MTPTRILIADDHSIVRHGIRLMLDKHDDLTVVAEAGDGAEAVQVALAEDVDLAILDVAMPRLTGLQAARQMLAQRPEMKILMLSMHDDEQFFFEALRAGAAGYVLKSAAHQDLVAACRAATRGEPFVHPQGVAALIRQYLDNGDASGPEDPLSPRETEVVKLIAEGHTSREIAEVLVISENTVERHRANAIQKLGVRDRVGLTRYAIRRGLVQP